MCSGARIVAAASSRLSLGRFFALAVCILGAVPAIAQVRPPALPALRVSIAAAPEVVFDSRNGCDREDIPDIALRVFRRADGQRVGFGSHYTTRTFMIDADGSFRRDCALVLTSAKNPDPGRYDDRTWIAATWTDDGKTVIALGHNEFQGNQHWGTCAYREYLQCWYNSIVLLKSVDAGRTFARIPGAMPIANADFTHAERQGEPRGFFEPSNIIKKGGFFYTLIFTAGAGEQKRGTCLFRTKRLEVDSAWEYWTRSGFAPSARDPYRQKMPTTDPCQPLRNLRGPAWSIVRHRGTGLYLASVGVQNPNMQTGVIEISVSKDLLHWSAPVAVLNVPIIWSQIRSDQRRYSYAALLDLTSADRNFGDVGDRPQLYLSEIDISGGNTTFNRRLIRYGLSLRLE